MVYSVLSKTCKPLKSQRFDKASLKSKSYVYTAHGNAPFIAFISSLFQALGGQAGKQKKND